VIHVIRILRKRLSSIYQTNSSVHLLLAPLRHKLVAVLNLSPPRQLHQAWGTTQANRRPELLNALASIVPDNEGLKVLSCGCSTGEEVVDLLDHYRRGFVYGTDLHRGRLRRARKQVGNRATLFVSSEALLRYHGPFDLIIACSVFLRHPEDTHTENLSLIYPFSQFEDGIHSLCSAVHSGGYLLIHNSNYRVMDTVLASRLEPICHPVITQNPNVPCFGRDGKKTQQGHMHEQLFRVR